MGWPALDVYNCSSLALEFSQLECTYLFWTKSNIDFKSAGARGYKKTLLPHGEREYTKMHVHLLRSPAKRNSSNRRLNANVMI